MKNNEFDEIQKDIRLKKIMDIILVPVILPAMAGLFLLAISIFALVFSLIKVVIVGIINLIN